MLKRIWAKLWKQQQDLIDRLLKGELPYEVILMDSFRSERPKGQEDNKDWKYTAKVYRNEMLHPCAKLKYSWFINTFKRWAPEGFMIRHYCILDLIYFGDVIEKGIDKSISYKDFGYYKKVREYYAQLSPFCDGLSVNWRKNIFPILWHWSQGFDSDFFVGDTDKIDLLGVMRNA